MPILGSVRLAVSAAVTRETLTPQPPTTNDISPSTLQGGNAVISNSRPPRCHRSHAARVPFMTIMALSSTRARRHETGVASGGISPQLELIAPFLFSILDPRHCWLVMLKNKITRTTLLLRLRWCPSFYFFKNSSACWHSLSILEGLWLHLTFVHLYFTFTMLLSIAKAAALTILLCPLVTPLRLPSTDILTPRVPWKEHGLWDHKRRTDYGNSTGNSTSGDCNHGPKSRGCWHGEFDIDTDMDLQWPNTGKVVKVCSYSLIMKVVAN
jgi:hypothetical protein